MNRYLLAAACLAATWVVVAVARLTVRRWLSHRVVNGSVLMLAGRAATAAIMTAGALTALGTAGVDVSALVAGLGLTGFALGFAVKDALSNLLAGILTLIYRPFRPGDRVQVMGLEGVVRDVDLRYTTLDADDRRFLVPNSALFSNPITVWRENRHEPSMGASRAAPL